MASIDELSIKIENLSKSLETSAKKADELKAKLSSGMFSPADLDIFRDKLIKLEELIGKKQVKIQSLVEERAMSEINSLNAAIETLKNNINAKRLEIKVDDGGNIQRLEKELLNLERASKSFESRKWNQFSASGLRKTSVDTAPFSEVDLDARVSPRASSSKQYRDLIAKQEATRRKAEEEAVLALKEALALPEQVYIDIDKSFKEAKERFNAERAASKVTNTVQTPNTARANPVLDLSEQIELNIPATEAEKRKAAQEKMNQAMQTYSQELLRASDALARNQGFAPTDLKQVLRAGQGGLHQSTYARQDPSTGVTQKLNIVEDKYGNVSPQIPRNLQTFTQGVTRDIRELAKWSIAISVIYGPLNKLSEMFVQMVDNETKLADATVAVSDSMATQGEIFDATYASAQSAGEGVSGVIDAFNQAFRAAGRFSDEGIRFSMSIKLMNDSLVLSKLSSLDQAQAIDTLTAALYQSGRPLDQGKSLLDEWVKVSRVANVDLATLATGVAVLGDTAETAGLSMEQLNAMIATIAETSLAGGKEAANIAKALIGNYQSDTAVKELNRLGIAVTDSTGKTREFLDVMQQVYSMRSEGIISNEQFNKLTLALGGGGVRRQKDVSAFIENMPRMQQIVGLQENSTGEAANAMAKKLDTLQTATTRFENALQSLMQTLGDNGGLLDLFKNIVNIGTTLVEIIDKLTEGLGKAAPLLYTVGIAAMLTRDRGGLPGLAYTAGSFVTSTLAGGKPYGVPGGLIGPGMASQGMAVGVGNKVTSLLMNPYAQTAIGVGSMVAGNLSEGKDAEAVGNVIGGAIGFALTGGNPIGAIIGAGIADAFVSKTMTYDGTLADFFAGITKPTDSTDTTGNQTGEELRNEAFKLLGGSGGQLWGQLLAFDRQVTSKRSAEQASTFGTPIKGFEALGKGYYSTPEAAALDMLKNGTKEQQEYAAYLQMKFAESGQAVPGQTSLFSKQVKAQQSTRTLGYLEKISAERRQELLGQLTNGEIKPADYTRRLEDLSAFSAQSTTFMAAFGDKFIEMNKSIDNTSEAYKAFLDILSSGNEEQVSYLNSMIADYSYLIELLQNWDDTQKTSETKFGTMTKEGVQQRANALQSEMAATANSMYISAGLQNNPLPSIVNLQGGTDAMKNKDLSAVLQETKKAQEKFYKESGYSSDQIAEYEKRLEKFSVLVEEGGKVFYRMIEGIDQKFLSSEYAKMIDSGKIETPKKDVGIQTYDVTKEQYNQAVSQYDSFKSKMEALGYTAKEEKQIVKLSDSDYFADRKDFKLIQLLLGQIADNTKQNIDGMFNLPEGASFYVNLAAAKMHMDTVNAMDQTVTQPDTGVAPPTTETQTPPNPSVDTGTYDRSDVLDLLEAGRKKWRDYIEQSTQVPTENVQPADRSDLMMNGAPVYNPSTPQQQQQGMGAPGVGWLDFGAILANMLRNAINGTQQGVPGIGEGEKLGTSFRDMSANQSAQSISTKFDINFESHTQLLVDGRILASIIKPYMSSDLVQTQQSQSTITRRYVI